MQQFSTIGLISRRDNRDLLDTLTQVANFLTRRTHTTLVVDESAAFLLANLVGGSGPLAPFALGGQDRNWGEIGGGLTIELGPTDSVVLAVPPRPAAALSRALPSRHPRLQAQELP